MVEADGKWHITDNKYTSLQWQESHPPAPKPRSLPIRRPMPFIQSPSSPSIKKENGDGTNVVVLDSDDEDEGRMKRELSPSFVSSPGNRSYSDILPSQSKVAEREKQW